MIEDFLLKSPTLAMIRKHEYPTDKLQQCTKSSLQVAMQIFPKHNPEKIYFKVLVFFVVLFKSDLSVI